MEPWLCGIIGILVASIIALLVKLYSMKKAAKEIEVAFAERLMIDTNTLIDIASGDKHMRRLANSINKQLCILRTQRHRFTQGDTELKNAVTNISHDLRTPLTAIYGYLDLLEQEEVSESVERYLGIIRNRAEMMTQLTEELFRYSVILTTKNDFVKESVIVNGVLEESVAAFYTAFCERGITPKIWMPEKKLFGVLTVSRCLGCFPIC